MNSTSLADVRALARYDEMHIAPVIEELKYLRGDRDKALAEVTENLKDDEARWIAELSTDLADFGFQPDEYRRAYAEYCNEYLELSRRRLASYKENPGDDDKPKRPKLGQPGWSLPPVRTSAPARGRTQEERDARETARDYIGHAAADAMVWDGTRLVAAGSPAALAARSGRTRNPGFKPGDRVTYGEPDKNTAEDDSWGDRGVVHSVQPERVVVDLEVSGERGVFTADELRHDRAGVDVGVPTCPACKLPAHASDSDDDDYHAGCRPTPNPSRKRNPSVEASKLAISKYQEFHRLEPKKLGTFSDSFAIPDIVISAGRAKFTTYRSGKVDPSTLKQPRKPVNYIHEHDAGVVVYLSKAGARELGVSTAGRTHVPPPFRNIDTLVLLGDSLGFAYEDEHGDELEVLSGEPLPELYCSPCGKCLYVIQSKRSVLAMLWGGALGVFGRGIDG